MDSSRAARTLWALLAAGLVLRVFAAFHWYGGRFDIDSYELVYNALRDDPFGVYRIADLDQFPLARWPYPPLLFPWIYLAGSSGLEFHGVIQLAAIAGDLGLAYVVYRFLPGTERRRLAGAALIALGPAFIGVSGYHGHFDSLAILPAVLAVALFTRERFERSGVLVGVGAALKSVPGLTLLALLPSARTLREGLQLIVPALAIPALLFLPFAIAEPTAVKEALRYGGVPGVGGISLLVQPDLASNWIAGAANPLSGASEALLDARSFLALASVVGLGLFLLRTRPAPVKAAAFLWVAFLALTPNYVLHYAIWALPFLILAGHLRLALWIQLVSAIPQALLYSAPHADGALIDLYRLMMLVLWMTWVGAALHLGRKLVVERQPIASMR